MPFAWLFLLWPLLEIGLFVTLGGWIGVWATLAIVLGSAVLGVFVIRWQTRFVMGQVLRDLQSLGDAVTPAAHSAMIVLAGVLLILPGFLTDALGLVLLLPPVRNFAIGLLRARARPLWMQGAGGMATRRYDVIDVEAEEVPPSTLPLHKPSGWTKP